MLSLSTLTITSITTIFTHLMDSLFHSTLVYSEPEVYSKPITVCGNGYIQRLYYNYFYKLSSFWQYQLFTLSTLKIKFYELFECRFHSNRFHSNILFSKGLIHRISHVLRLDLSPRLIFSTVQTVCVCVCVWWGGERRGLWAVSRVESSARVRLAFRALSCWEASVILYLWFPF